MSSKHFINDPTHLVHSALHAVTLTNPLVALDSENKIIYLRPISSSLSSPAAQASQVLQGLQTSFESLAVKAADTIRGETRDRPSVTRNAASQVSIISGGGSGHEPSFASFVGPGLLSAAVAGTIFASPGAEQVRRCILGRVERDRGVLVVVMNYTGDVLNFGRAEQKARAAGVDVEMVVVGDDVGVGREQGGKVGRRGIAGTVLVHKIAGAAATGGASLKQVHEVAQLVADNLVSIGASLSHVHVPGRSITEEGQDDLGEAEVEIGMGIHNEPGSERRKEDLPGLVKTMLAHLLDPEDKDRAFLPISSSDEIVLLMNNLGGVSVLELGGITHEVCEQLEKTWSIRPVRVISGTFMTSLNGLGFSITLLRVRDTALGVGKGMLELLDAPAEATGWTASIQRKTWENCTEATRDEDADEASKPQPSNLQTDPAMVRKALETSLNRLNAAEPEITNYDTIVGDGDCGIGLSRGATGILKMIEKSRHEVLSDAVLLMHAIIRVVESTMDGTSGALYAIYLNAVAAALSQMSVDEPRPVTPQDWAKALVEASKALEKYTPARPGDRTLVDALQPFVRELKSSGDIMKAADKAQEGSAKTKGMKASLGRTVYIGGEGAKHVPDPGAYGLAEFFAGLAEGLAQ